MGEAAMMHDEEGYVSEKAPPPSQAFSGLLLLVCALAVALWRGV